MHLSNPYLERLAQSAELPVFLSTLVTPSTPLHSTATSAIRQSNQRHHFRNRTCLHFSLLVTACHCLSILVNSCHHFSQIKLVNTFVTALVSTSHYLSPLVTACQFLSPLLTTCLHLSIFVSTSHYLSLLVNSCVTLVTFSVDMLATSSLCYIGTLQ